MFNFIVGNPANLAKIPPTGRTMEWDEKEKTWSPAYEITPHSLEKKQLSSKQIRLALSLGKNCNKSFTEMDDAILVHSLDYMICFCSFQENPANPGEADCCEYQQTLTFQQK